MGSVYKPKKRLASGAVWESKVWWAKYRLNGRVIRRNTKRESEAKVDILDTPRWYSRLQRKDYTIGLNVTGVSVDDPDGNLVENYSCNSERNYTQYCIAEVDRLLAAQSREVDKDTRRTIVFDIARLLVEDAARPVILHSSVGNCWQPYVKNFRPHDNSQYNNLRFEDVWLDK